MTTSTIAHIPVALGAGLAAITGRAMSWSFARIMRAPMASAILFVAVGLTMMAAANALFLQEGRHPAPLFIDGAMTTGSTTAPPPVPPVVAQPPERPADLAASHPQQAEPSIQQQAAPPESAASTPEESRPAGNVEIAELQEKLRAMGIFDGTVDGFYGPKTADAIRAFEARFDMPRTGAASAAVLEAVREAPLDTSAQRPAQAQDAPTYSAEIAALIEESGSAGLSPASQSVAANGTGGAGEEIATVGLATTEAAPRAADPVPPALDSDLIQAVQLGLSKLGFLHAPATGRIDETTAQAIRKFQVFHNYPATGEVTSELLHRLAAAGADM